MARPKKRRTIKPRGRVNSQAEPKGKASTLPDFWEDFRRVLRQTRLAAGLSQDVVAAALGITRSTYTYYECGKTAPDLASVRKMAEIFQVPVDIFLYPEEVPVGESVRVVRAKAEDEPVTMGQLSREEQELVAKYRAEKVPAN